MIKPGAYLSKGAPESYQHVEVRGQPGLWLQGEHYLILKSGQASQNDVMAQVSGNVLVWEENGITCRLESGFDLEQSQLIAPHSSHIHKPEKFGPFKISAKAEDVAIWEILGSILFWGAKSKMEPRPGQQCIDSN